MPYQIPGTEHRTYAIICVYARVPLRHWQHVELASWQKILRCVRETSVRRGGEPGVGGKRAKRKGKMVPAHSTSARKKSSTKNSKSCAKLQDSFLIGREERKTNAKLADRTRSGRQASAWSLVAGSATPQRNRTAGPAHVVKNCTQIQVRAQTAAQLNSKSTQQRGNLACMYVRARQKRA